MGMSLNIKQGSMSYVLLTLLEGAVDGAVLLNDFVNHMDNYSILGRDYPLKKSTLSKAIVRLKENGLIAQEKIEEGEMVLKLTDEGRMSLLLIKEDEKTWDGRFRVVIFDIPEQKRLVRDLFRRNLKKWGFKNLQKSVWISKKHITEKLIGYIKYLKIEKWVLVIESDKIRPNPVTSTIV